MTLHALELGMRSWRVPFKCKLEHKLDQFAQPKQGLNSPIKMRVVKYTHPLQSIEIEEIEESSRARQRQQSSLYGAEPESQPQRIQIMLHLEAISTSFWFVAVA